MMRHSKTAISFFILVAVLGSQAGLIQGEFTELSHPVGKSVRNAEVELGKETTALLEILYP